MWLEDGGMHAFDDNTTGRTVAFAFMLYNQIYFHLSQLILAFIPEKNTSSDKQNEIYF